MNKDLKHSNFSFLEKKLDFVCFPPNPSFLEKGVKNGGKQTNSKKKVLPEKGKTFV